MDLEDMDFEEKLDLAERSTDPDILDQLSTDEDADVREAVAGNENCYPHVLEHTLSKDKKAEVRFYVAGNPNCPLHVLEELSTDEDEYVRAAVAGNKNCPPDVLEHPLSKDENEYVREAVAANPNCPDPALINLCDDSDKTVRDAVANNPRSFYIPQIAEKLKAFNKKIINEYTKTKIPKNLNAPSHLHKSINTDLELLLALHKYLTRGN